MSVLDSAFGLADAWPVTESSIAVIHAGGTELHGDEHRRQRIASVSKRNAAFFDGNENGPGGERFTD